MRLVRFAVKLPFFLVAEARIVVRRLPPLYQYDGFKRGHEVLETHKKLVDWLWGCAQGI
jgi:hypothetical protein